MHAEAFTIVFDKLNEALEQEGLVTDGTIKVSEIDPGELTEIDELRRFVLEIDEPEPSSYTLT